MKVLFVGGPRDGRRDHWYSGVGPAIVHKIVPTGNTILAPGATIGMSTHTYTLKQYNFSDGSTLAIAVDSTVKDVMKQLVKGYHYHRNPRSRSSRKRKP